MLRVRPTIHTPHPEAWARLLNGLGLGEITPPPATGSPSGTTQRCFAADSGRILLHESTRPGTELVFEVRDLEKFAQWTIADGTPVDLVTAADGSTALAHLTAPDGLSFTALGVDAAVDAGTPRFPQDTEPPRAGTLAVLALWHTPDVPGASSTLANIGAKPEAASVGGGVARYRAKHGGFVAAHAGANRGIELSLEYSGALEALAATLSGAGRDHELVDESYGRTLLVEHPDGDRLCINERQTDPYGYTRR